MSKRSERHDRFRSLPLFAQCGSKELEEIDHLADEVQIPAGRVIMSQGDLGQEFALIVSGEAEIVKDGVTVATIGPGDYFGEVALLNPINRTASVVAKTDLDLQVLDRRGFNTLLDDMPHLSRSILKGIAYRLVELETENHRLRDESHH